MAMVIFRDYEEAQRCAVAIRDCRQRLGSTREFHFNKCSDAWRDCFFESIKPFDFGVRAIVVDKKVIYSEHLKRTDDHFYNFFVKCLVSNQRGALKAARIKIDGSGSREFKNHLATYLRKHCERDVVASLKFIDSHRDDLVQMADMVAGAIARARQDKTKRANPTRWRSFIAKHIEDEWDFR